MCRILALTSSLEFALTALAFTTSGLIIAYTTIVVGSFKTLADSLIRLALHLPHTHGVVEFLFIPTFNLSEFECSNRFSKPF
jgi:hypothetical protein